MTQAKVGEHDYVLTLARTADRDTLGMQRCSWLFLSDGCQSYMLCAGVS